MARRRRFEDINPGDTLYVYNLGMMFLEKCPIAMVNSGADAHHIELTYEVAPLTPRKIQATYNARAFTQENKLYAVDSEAVKDALPRILNKRLELLNKERKQLVSQIEKVHKGLFAVDRDIELTTKKLDSL